MPRSPPRWQETREAPRAAAGHTPRDAPGPARPRGRGRWGLQGCRAAASAFIPARGQAGEDASQTAANRLSLRVSTAITAGLSIRPHPHPSQTPPGEWGEGVPDLQVSYLLAWGLQVPPTHLFERKKKKKSNWRCFAPGWCPRKTKLMEKI